MILTSSFYPLSRSISALTLSGLITVMAIPTVLASQKKVESAHQHANASHTKSTKAKHPSSPKKIKKKFSLTRQAISHMINQAMLSLLPGASSLNRNFQRLFAKN